VDTTGYVATCTATRNDAPYLKTTCAPETISDVAVPARRALPAPPAPWSPRARRRPPARSRA
jgi:hypothetical protein